MPDLAAKDCVPCTGNESPLRGPALQSLHAQLDNDWQVVKEHHLRKRFTFGNFQEALDFVNRVGALAEAQGHHPDLHLGWGKVDVLVWTHAIDGLTESDFVFAAKADGLA